MANWTARASKVSAIEGNYTNKMKHWDNLENVSKSGAYALCSNFATKSGTFNRPATITLTDFGIKNVSGVGISKVILHYSQKKYTKSSSTAYPDIPAPTITLAGISKTGQAPTKDYKEYTIEYTGITLSQLSSQNLQLIINYPNNQNGNTGDLALGNVYLEIITTTTNITVNSTATKSKININDTINITFQVNKHDTIEYIPHEAIETSNGIEYVKKVSGTGEITKETDYLEWVSTLTNNTTTITIQFKATKTGTQTIKITDTLTQKTHTLQLQVTQTTTTVDSQLAETITENKPNTTPTTIKKTNADGNIDTISYNNGITAGETKTYNITFTTTDSSITQDTYEIILPDCAEIEGVTGTTSHTTNIIDNSLVLRVVVPFKNKTALISISVTFNDSGYYTQSIYNHNELIHSENFRVKAQTLQDMTYTRVPVSTVTKDRMGHGITYIATSWLRYVNISDTVKQFAIINYRTNLRFGIFNADEKYLSNPRSFIAHTQFCSSHCTEKLQEFKVEFKYNENYPIYYVWTQDYREEGTFEILSIEFSEPTLFEKTYYNNHPTRAETQAILPYPLKSLIQHEGYGKLDLKKNKNSDSFIIDLLPDNGISHLENFVIEGIQLNCEYITDHDVQAVFKLHINGKTGYRNITFTKGSGVKSVGGKLDLWELKPSDFRNKLDSMQMEIFFQNPYSYDAVPTFRWFNYDINYLLSEKSGHEFWVDGECSTDYGVFLKSVTLNPGTENEIKTLHVSGTDNTKVYRSNINSKEIELEIVVGDECSLDDSIILLDRVVKLFTNEREDITNTPTPKALVFDFMKDRQFMFILEETMEDEIEINEFTLNIKLNIPSGTAESINNRITGSKGNNTGLARVQPIIQVISTGTQTITLTKKDSHQTLTINNTNFKANDIITIHNTEHIVYLTRDNKTTDITDKVDYNSTWFTLLNEYEFEYSGCIFHRTIYKERL